MRTPLYPFGTALSLVGTQRTTPHAAHSCSTAPSLFGTPSPYLVWQGPSWSTLEYDGSLKLSHHAVRRAFAPLLLAGRVALAEGSARSAGSAREELRISLTSDWPDPIGGLLSLEVRRWDAPTAAVMARRSARVVAPPQGSAEVRELETRL